MNGQLYQLLGDGHAASDELVSREAHFATEPDSVALARGDAARDFDNPLASSSAGASVSSASIASSAYPWTRADGGR